MFGQAFYELRDINLMEQEMIHYPSWDLTISGPNPTAFADSIKANYKKGVPKAPYVVIPDKSRGKDSFGKGVIEERETVASEPTSTKKPTPMPISIPFRARYCRLPSLHLERSPTILHHIS